jgi:TRAP-type C4-dicarboxylate transport system substrate-binding protein
MKIRKKKPVFAVLLCLCMLAFSAACGEKESPAEESGSVSGSAETEAPEAQTKTVIWNAGTINTDPAVSDVYNSEGHALALFAEKVNEYTNGAIEVNVHWGGTLGANPQLLEQAEMGEIDVFCGMPMSTAEPRFNVFGIPFVWKNLEQIDAAIDGGNGEIFKLTEQLFAERGLHLAGMGAGSLRGYANTKKDIFVPDDVKGVKTRVYESELVRAFWDKLTQTQMMSAMDIYTGLETGAVDGFENANTVIMVLKYYEVIKYFTDLNWQWANSAVYVISDKAWTALTNEQQEAVRKAAWEAAALETKEQIADQESANADLESKGVKITQITDEQYAAWIAYNDSLKDRYKEIVGAEFYDVYMKAVEAGQ